MHSPGELHECWLVCKFLGNTLAILDSELPDPKLNVLSPDKLEFGMMFRIDIAGDEKHGAGTEILAPTSKGGSKSQTGSKKIEAVTLGRE